MPTEGGRRLTRASIGLAIATLAALPTGLIAAFVVAGPAVAVLVLLRVPVAAALLFVAVAYLVWALCAPLVLCEAFADALARGVLRMRLPSPSENRVLSSRWAAVCAGTGMVPTRFHLRVDPCRGINAATAARTIVGVTPEALALPESDLDVILAHEAGHHAHLHAVWGTLTLWWLAPLALLDALLRLVLRWLQALPFPFGLVFGALMAAVRGLIGLALAPFLLVRSVASRAAEYEADAFSVRHADGRVAIRLLESFAEAERTRTSGFFAAALATHPPAVDRVARVQELVARSRTGNQPTARAGSAV